MVPAKWMPACNMKRVVAHWSAGGHIASAIDKKHYHIIIQGDGSLIRGDHSIDDNANTADGDYAAHTRGCNTGAIGVSLACMAGAIENPFNPGKFPMTKKQWDALSTVLAELCKFYKIPVTAKTVLSHAEVQGTLGIAQRGKWDFTRLAFDPSIKGAKAIGDRLRAEVAAKLAKL
jgi:N-acetyl-anhydromuramyl-L-alanine amidase AmpD